MSFIIAGLVFTLTLAYFGIAILANSMSDAPSQGGISIVGPFIGGTTISLLILASHWLPKIGW